MNKFQKTVNKSSKRMTVGLGYKYSAARKETRKIVKDFIKTLGKYPSWG